MAESALGVALRINGESFRGYDDGGDWLQRVAGAFAASILFGQRIELVVDGR